MLLWKHNMHIEYLAAASWPLDPTKRTTRVEVTMEGSYDILHDISCTQRKPITSPYRTSVIRRFWNTLQRCKSAESFPTAAAAVRNTTPPFVGERVGKLGGQTITGMQPLLFQHQPNRPDVGASSVFYLDSRELHDSREHQKWSSPVLHPAWINNSGTVLSSV